jgi:AcrR family transcriptional regulator
VASGTVTPGSAKPGLRERRRAKTEAAIRHEAIGLFRRYGYSATTVEQIADAADVSPSTFFRYFPSKEALLFIEAEEQAIITAFEQSLPETTPIQALGRAMRALIAGMTPEELKDIQARNAIIFTTPELAGPLLNYKLASTRLMAGLIAERYRQPADSLEITTFVGAIQGARLAVMAYWGDHPDIDIAATWQAAFDLLEKRMPL